MEIKANFRCNYVLKSFDLNQNVLAMKGLGLPLTQKGLILFDKLYS